MGTNVDIYRAEILKAWRNPLGSGHAVVTATFLFDEEDKPDGVHWLTEDGRPRFIGTGQGKWFVLSRDRAVILQDEQGYMPIARFDYRRWPWNKGDMGKVRYFGPGTNKPMEFEYRITMVQ